MENLKAADAVIKEFEKKIADPIQYGQLKGKKLFVGVDLGTAYIVLAIVDEEGNPVAGAMRFAQVVKDGLVVDYIGAIDIVKTLKKEIEGKIGVELEFAGVAYPPGTSKNDRKAIINVAEAAGLKVLLEIDEPTAANKVLSITGGAVVDIGGGTTGIAIFQNGQVVYVADEPTGGTHFSLVISGAYKIPFEEAEEKKKNPQNHQEVLPIVIPVIQKVASIIKKHIKVYDVAKVFLVGGTCCLQNFEKIMEEELNIPVIKPANPFLVTPLGIAISTKETHRERVKR
ncbi:MAG: ethanolamine utilization protein EutJ [Peptococcaceae bacterium BICA1-8]|nr:MAG: ethanolamine utilization protein EutJ [Peptococcaceae bacterium BICA1-8]